MNIDIENKKRKLVEHYFRLVSELEKGDKIIAGTLMSLWNIDGVFEIEGIQPFSEVYEGQLAIHNMYIKKFSIGNLLFKSGEKSFRTHPLAGIDREIKNIREEKGLISALWSSHIKTADGGYLDIEGTHVFTIKKGKIGHLHIIVSWISFSNKNSTGNDISIDQLREFIV